MGFLVSPRIYSFTTSCPRTLFHEPRGQRIYFNPGIFSTAMSRYDVLDYDVIVQIILYFLKTMRFLFW